MITQKRDSLEKFIKEQMVGPGGCGDRFSYVSPQENLVSNALNRDEVVNTTPGSIYSTAILFPRKSDADDGISEQNRITIKDIDSQEGKDNDIETELDEISGENTSLEEDEDILSLSRRFPNTIGFSCCFKEGTSFSEVKIFVKGRYYHQIRKDEFSRVAVKILDFRNDFEFFWENKIELQDFFSYENGFLFIKKEMEKDYLKGLNMELASNIGKNDPDFLEIKENYRYLLSYKERLFAKLKIVKLEDDIEQIKNKIKEIEKYETVLSYFENLNELYDSRNFGFWRSESFCKELQIPDTLEFSGCRKIYKPQEFTSLKEFIQFEFLENKKQHKAALSAWMQLTRNVRDPDDKNLYFKISINNDSDPFIQTKKDYFSIVNEKVNRRCFFGIELSVESENLVPLDQQSSIIDDEELKRSVFLYRSLEDYGVGHGCSVKWSPEKKAQEISTDFIPTYNVPDVDVVPRDACNFDNDGNPVELLDNNPCLQFKWLSVFSTVSDEEIRKGLSGFIEKYKRWIDGLRGDITDGFDSEIAQEQLRLCEKDYKRIQDNLKYLDDSKNMLCFRLMNSAMFMQLWHGKEKNRAKFKEWIKRNSYDYSFYKTEDDCIFGNEHAAWRPFQLAFILLTIESVFEPDAEKSKRNNLVDLVWFPTGGGKTEAYLGIIALTIIFRRLVMNTDGCTVIMRYTLRLLTAQQFERATKLILALENIRRWGKKEWNLGKEEISIGLFIGSASLPNSKKDLTEEAQKWICLDNEGKRSPSKIPLDKCPICGSNLTWDVSDFSCSDVNCPFDDPIPIFLCDELIYEKQPTLLFGTVDKFAALAHKVAKENIKDSRRLFSPNPPDLIIQDELHLLQGPLGTAAALFECAIDALCTKNGKRPKIISSTATTRNTSLQIRALYDRDVNIFPKNGLSYDDSFFAFYKRKKYGNDIKFESKRKYMGILPTGRTQMTTQMRLAAMLLVHRALWEKQHLNELTNEEYIKSADFYYSVISYFNSLREVGKTDAQFHLEFNKYVKRLFKRVCNPGELIELYYANDGLKSCELTGRLLGPEVHQNLDKVSSTFDATKRDSKNNPPDFILATNMISVGIDVDRFNTMIINSMPRNIAEYIQASSRVARKDLGLVITLHNPFRSRDISHFENFRIFHEKMYFYVEPISITPFSQKSVDLYMPLFLATVVRHKFTDLALRDAASKISEKVKEDILKWSCEYFKMRKNRNDALVDERLKNLLDEDALNRLERFVESALEEWINRNNQIDGQKFVYENADIRRKEKDLFFEAEELGEIRAGSKWIVPNSLRSVDPSVAIHIELGADNDYKK